MKQNVSTWWITISMLQLSLTITHIHITTTWFKGTESSLTGGKCNTVSQHLLHTLFISHSYWTDLHCVLHSLTLFITRTTNTVGVNDRADNTLCGHATLHNVELLESPSILIVLCHTNIYITHIHWCAQYNTIHIASWLYFILHIYLFSIFTIREQVTKSHNSPHTVIFGSLTSGYIWTPVNTSTSTWIKTNNHYQ